MTKNTVLQIRLTAPEKLACQAAADLKRVPLSVWVRDRLLGTVKDRTVRTQRPKAKVIRFKPIRLKDFKRKMTVANSKLPAYNWTCRHCKWKGTAVKGQEIASHYVASSGCRVPSLQIGEVIKKKK